MSLFINLLEVNPALYALLLFAIVSSVVLHELGHAFAAEWQGDPTPRMLGYITLDPRKHMGWLSLAMAAIFGIAFGSVPVQPRNFRNRRWGDAMVSFAGPLVNLILCVVAAVMAAGSMRAGAGPLIETFWYYLCVWNALLFLFNMFPLPPFDGFNVARAFISFGSLESSLRRSGMMNLFAAILAFNFLGGMDLSFGTAKFLIGFFSGLFGG